MSARSSNPNSGAPDDEDPAIRQGNVGGEEIRDDDGLLVDEYSSEAFGDPDALDALDIPAALEDEDVLEDIADDSDGIEEVDVLAAGQAMDTVDSGARRPAPTDEAEMGLGAEPRSPEELEDAAIGRALRGRAGVTRDDEVHGERLLDDPEESARDEDDATA
jgi:hypothetical protein